MIPIEPQNDLRSIGQLCADFQQSFRSIEKLIVSLKLRAWRINGTLFIDGAAVERIAAELAKQPRTGVRRFTARGGK